MSVLLNRLSSRFPAEQPVLPPPGARDRRRHRRAGRWLGRDRA